MQAFAFNIRRDKFKDPRVRRAFNFAFDFEEMNRQIFFGQYKRIASYFEGHRTRRHRRSRTARNWKFWKRVRDKVPAELFTKPYTNPVGGNPQAVRNNLREALALFREAGYEIREHQAGQCQDRRAISRSSSWWTIQPTERFVLFYKPSLERLGMNVDVRVVDAAQYENRLRQWDFDIIIASWRQSLSPGNEQRDFWSSQAADQPGSRNSDRHQESGGRYADRTRDFRQGSRGSGRRHQGARPRAAVEFLRRAAMDLSATSAPRAGIASAVPRPCRNTARSAFPTVWWWDAAKGGESAATIVIA